MTDEKAAYLEDVRSQMGLSKEQADKAVKSVKTEVFGMSAAQVEGGKWDLDRLMQVHATSPGSVESTVEEGTRRNIFRRELEKRIADGSGDLDAEWMLKKVPEVLALPQRKVDMIVKELVASRKRMLLVQAVSQYRQKRTGEVLTTLNNLISATKALPEAGPMAWTEKEEVKELFTLYCSKQPSADKREYLAGVMGISPEEAAALSAAGPTDGGAPKAAADQEDDDAFF